VRLKSRLPKIDLLINNAGGMNAQRRQVTVEGLERQLVGTFLGHFALTAKLGCVDKRDSQTG
jgi:NAD(P)-dependent dehydrogenase (short-subunit alcohol dehydrogenase family)